MSGGNGVDGRNPLAGAFLAAFLALFFVGPLFDAPRDNRFFAIYLSFLGGDGGGGG